MSQPRLALLLCLVLVLEGTSGSFFRPLTCHQDPSHKKICGGEPESFYPSQCLKKKCCYENHTCYHHVIDGAKQSRNAGIIGGIAIAVVLCTICLFFGWKFKEFQRKEKESEIPRSEGEMADYLVKLLDEESETDEYRRAESLDQGDSWGHQSFIQPAWRPETPDYMGGIEETMWSPEPSPKLSPEPMKLAGPTPALMPEPAPAPPPQPAPPPAPAPAAPPAPPPAAPPAPPPAAPPAPPPAAPPAPPPEVPPAPPPGAPPAPPPGAPPAPPPGAPPAPPPDAPPAPPPPAPPAPPPAEASPSAAAPPPPAPPAPPPPAPATPAPPPPAPPPPAPPAPPP